MSKSILSLMFLSLCALLNIHAATLPTASTEGNETWYMIRFLNGQNVLTAGADGQNVTVQMPTGRNSQWWKVEGNNTTGYKFISRTGLTLTNTTGQKEGIFQAALAPTNNILYKLVTSTSAQYSGEWLIAPKTNTSLFMNQWGGAETGAQLGLWDTRADANQPLVFVVEADFQANGQPLPLIPYPQTVIRGEGTCSVAGLCAVYAPSEDAKRAVQPFISDLSRVSGKEPLAIHDTEVDCYSINMTVDETLGAEAYKLKISENQVYIQAKEFAGFFYALQTLRQLLPTTIYGQGVDATFAQWTLPVVDIADEPLMGYRGFHFDVSRHFFTLDEVKKLLRTAATYKFNRFHWHLTDDQGWRIEIPEYPKLTTVGAIRKASLTIAGNPNFYDDTEYGRGCYYTLEELREIVQYAKDLNIEIMPEIDLPGHMVAVLASYPELSCDPTKKYEVRVDGGIARDVLNIGKDESIDFLKCVLGHVAQVFPYQYVHIGGDECPTDNWQNNPDCLRRVQEEGLNGVNELQSWLVEELGKWLKQEYNKDIMVWDELLSHWKSDNTIKPVVMAWNGTGFTSQAANLGMKSVHVPYQYLYLDFQQVPDDQMLVDEPYSGGWGMNSVPKIYNFDPLVGMHDRAEFVMGAQGNLWTETCSSLKEAEYQYYPRLLALSEINWLPNNKKNWVSFYQRMQLNVKALDQQNITYAKHYIEQPELTASEATMQEAENLLAQSVAGAAGHPTVQAVEALQVALAGDVALLPQAIADFKATAVSQPKEGAIYRIISASTATNQRYAGSATYAKGEQLAIHYTAQAEPEELWQFVPQGDGKYIVRQAITGKELTMPTNSTSASISEKGTTVVLNQPTANDSYTYIPGVITLCASDQGSDIRLLTANANGILSAGSNAQLCQTATWRLEEVTDYRHFLSALVNKCQLIIEKSEPGTMNHPTTEALAFLGENVVQSAVALLESQEITREIYMQYAKLYEQFQAMPRSTVVGSLREDIYYRIRNGYFTDYYAWMNKSLRKVQPKVQGNGDAYLWYIRKHSNGMVSIYNKAYDAKSTNVTKSAADQSVRASGIDYTWTLDLLTTDTGGSGIVVLDPTGQYSWYTNPSSFSDIILKPKDWGASIWTFEATTEQVVTAISTLHTVTPKFSTQSYDLSGRPIGNNHHGASIVEGRVVVQ